MQWKNFCWLLAELIGYSARVGYQPGDWQGLLTSLFV